MSEGSEVQVAEAAETPKRNWRQVKAERAAAAEKAPPSQPPGRVRIMLEENDNIPPCGQFFGVNGATFILRPGMEASVPQGLVDILNNAVMEVPVVDPMTRQVIGWRKKTRYPYRLINETRSAAY
jgi:hypothetical protein